ARPGRHHVRPGPPAPGPVTETDRLLLEPVQQQHAEELYELYRDPAVAQWYGAWTLPEVRAEAARMAAGWRRDGVHKWMAFHRETGECVGRGGLSRQVVDGIDRLEVGWVLHQRFWGRGYATEIGRAGVDLAFGELGAREVVSFTEIGNRRSRAVMQ